MSATTIDKKQSVINKNPALADISIDEIEELLKEKRLAAIKEKEANRKTYEAKREETINSLCGFAVGLRDQMMDLKYEAFGELLKFRQEMLAYGDIRGGENNKGNFELKNDHFKIKFSSQVNKCFDERAELAEVKLKQFLSTFVKKNDKNSYQLVMALLERTKAGDFDINLINRLYTIRDKFDNPLWLEALDMFQESYCPYGTAQYIQFFTKNTTTNSWDAVVLDFAKLKSQNHVPNKTEAQA